MSPFRFVPIPSLVVFVVLAGLPACSLFRGSGTKQQLDPPPPVAHHAVDAKVKTMLLEVTTDASGAVVTITFKQSSGSDTLDNYVAQSVRDSWPATPSTRSLVELTYSAAREKRFSDPKVISSTPAP